jgi:hypothetical protein
MHRIVKYSTMSDTGWEFPSTGFGIVGKIMYVCSEAIREGLNETPHFAGR